MARPGAKDRGIVFKDDRWWVRLYVNGREKWFRADNKSQAKALYGRLKAEQREGKYFEKPKAIPFRGLLGDYIAAVDARRRRKGDDRSRAKHWLDAFGDQDAATITPRQIERVLTDLQTKGREPATLVRYLTTLKAVFNRAKRLGLLRDNPAALVQTPKVNNVLVRYLTPDQEAALLDVLPERFRPLVLTALNTGLRQGELLRLTWADVDWNVGVLTIQETKAGDRRRVPMNSKVQGILTDLKAKTAPALSDRIFIHDDRYLRRAFDRTVKVSGLAPFRFHDLRHTFASRLAMQGANDRTIMALGGWKSPRMLDRYAHLSPAHLWQAVEGLTHVGTGSKTGSNEKALRNDIAEGLEKFGAGKGI